AMNRKYTREQYLKLVEKIKSKIPKANLTTDVIVGFPGETKKAFENTLSLFKKINFSNAYIAKYSPRPGTSAWRLKDNITPREKKARAAELRKVLQN
ncbi:MAG: radical SAM protein, partial [bacterium]